MEVLSGQRSATSLGEGTCGREIKVTFYSDLQLFTDSFVRRESYNRPLNRVAA